MFFDGAGGAPGVGLDREGTECVGSDVVQDRMGGAIWLLNVVVCPALAVLREGDVGGAKVGAVKHDDLVVVHNLHVHGGDAYAAL